MNSELSAGGTATLQPPAANPDDLGIDRAFLMSMARIPLIAVGWVAFSIVAHQIWRAVAPGTDNFAPLVVLCFGMVVAAVIDGWAFKVPNWLTLSLVVSGWLIGGLHDGGVAVDIGIGGFGSAVLCTAIGFFLLFPLLAIVGMGQGDVKMLMGFGAWIGAFFGGREAVLILIWSFCLGAIFGGIFGLIMMVVRRKFTENAGNFKEIFVDLKVLMMVGPTKAAERAGSRRSRWHKLPYGIPLCVGFLGYLAYLYMDGTLPVPGK